MPDFKKARDYALDRLEHELSSQLTYHCLEHTKDEVVPVADHLASLEKVGDEDHTLLLTGAYFHDIGFIRRRQDHESISIQLAVEVLPNFGYTEAQITAVSGIIQATRLPQSPTNIMERIIADADMDDLGDENFWKRSNDLRQELENYGKTFTDEEWYTDQLHLMQSHNYFTKSEQALRNATKQHHILEVKRLLDQVKQVK